MNEQYSKKIMEALTEVLELDGTESRKEIENLYTDEEIFEAVLQYEGIYGYGHQILETLTEIFKFDIRELS